MARDLLKPAGQGDQGEADAELARVLAAAGDTGRIDPAALTVALREARVFVGVEAQATSVDEATGADRGSEMALITLRTASGASALPVFTSVATLAAWRPAARPVPVAGPDAFAQAAQEGLGAMVIDVAGPHTASLDLLPAREPSPELDDQSLSALRPPTDPDGPLSRTRVRSALRALALPITAWPAELTARPAADPAPASPAAAAAAAEADSASPAGGVGSGGRPVLVVMPRGRAGRQLDGVEVARLLSEQLGGGSGIAVLLVGAGLGQTLAVRRQLGHGLHA
ncbi:SseB family protein [Frankia sp. AgPm24]|uniref:SseB family protein n=1 Tax=Frankia sp. AgPm24 TaxID=631128 RepID=UPI00200D5780|nr:SseB family protein [Frankia sp. AgPm24]MCK9921496.1 SseB family protein [Frankia sp. AgPm24]